MRRALFLAFAVALVVLLAACSGGDDDDDAAVSTTTVAETTTTTVPRVTAADICAAPAPVQIGTLQDAALIELSGLEADEREGLLFYAHNDSGDTPRFFTFDGTGAAGGAVDVPGATATDWEDMTASADALYFGDIGDNFSQRSSIQVYKVPRGDARGEPETFELTYPDGAHDAETLMFDPVADELVVVTKTVGGNSGVYTRPVDTSGSLELVATLDLGIGELVTAGDISDSGDLVVLRTYGAVWVWDRAEGRSVAEAMGSVPCSAPSPTEVQGEAIALVSNGYVTNGYVTVSEGAGAAIWRVSATG